MPLFIPLFFTPLPCVPSFSCLFAFISHYLMLLLYLYVLLSSFVYFTLLLPHLSYSFLPSDALPLFLICFPFVPYYLMPLLPILSSFSYFATSFFLSYSLFYHVFPLLLISVSLPLRLPNACPNLSFPSFCSPVSRTPCHFFPTSSPPSFFLISFISYICFLLCLLPYARPDPSCLSLFSVSIFPPPCCFLHTFLMHFLSPTFSFCFLSFQPFCQFSSCLSSPFLSSFFSFPLFFLLHVTSFLPLLFPSLPCIPCQSYFVFPFPPTKLCFLPLPFLLPSTLCFTPCSFFPSFSIISLSPTQSLSSLSLLLPSSHYLRSFHPLLFFVFSPLFPLWHVFPTFLMHSLSLTFPLFPIHMIFLSLYLIPFLQHSFFPSSLSSPSPHPLPSSSFFISTAATTTAPLLTSPARSHEEEKFSIWETRDPWPKQTRC